MLYMDNIIYKKYQSITFNMMVNKHYSKNLKKIKNIHIQNILKFIIKKIIYHKIIQ